MYECFACMPAYVCVVNCHQCSEKETLLVLRHHARGVSLVRSRLTKNGTTWGNQSASQLRLSDSLAGGLLLIVMKQQIFHPTVIINFVNGRVH